MRLSILDHGHGAGTKLLFAVIRLVSRQPVSDVVKLLRYRADFFGKYLQVATHAAMRGASGWTVAERELMAAVVSEAHTCEFCVKTHTAVTAKALGGAVSQPLAALEREASEPLRATLVLLRKWLRQGVVDADDMRAVLAAGVSRAQIEDALAVGFVFSAMNRLANTFDFAVPTLPGLEASARYLLARGYR